MEVSRRRSTPRNVVAGSVWETRIQNDELDGGIKVFNGEENPEEGILDGDVGVELPNLANQKCSNGNQSESGVARERRKTWKPEPVEVIGRNIFQRRKSRSDSRKLSIESCKELNVSVNGVEKSPIHIKKTNRSDFRKIVDENCKEFEKIVEKNPIELKNSRSDSCKVLGETCEEFFDGKDEGEVEEEEEEMIEKKSFDVKVVKEEKKLNQIHEKPLPISPNVKKPPSFALNHLRKQPTISVSDEFERFPKMQHKLQTIVPVSEEFERLPKTQHKLQNIVPVSEEFERFPKTQDKLQNIGVSEEFERFPRTQHKLQSIVDLVMWRNVAKSALVFGFGIFILISSFYTKDLNFSLISAISYMGLLSLSAIFLYKSIICRRAVELDNSSEIHLVGEDEAIWLVKLVLPYLNEFLLKLRALFHGDPATTMKLAAILFVLARFGSSVTMWNMVKLGFFGVFTIPKACSSYSTQLSRYGKFWMRRMRDAWDSCTHKKTVVITIFTLVYNFSSLESRIWAVFMLIVAVRYYQQSLTRRD